ncbi:MAG: hypothetical protein JXX14_26140 [Deltaproteobacteria bacterium]|nr:hypothetical protein [Deltaproteobacteria bacterium]
MGFKEKWQHAFALAPEVAPEADALPDILEKFAITVVKRRMETPAILFLEMVKPLNFLGSQLVFAAVPIAGVFTSADELSQVAKALEHRGVIAALVTRIEELSIRRQ